MGEEGEERVEGEEEEGEGFVVDAWEVALRHSHQSLMRRSIYGDTIVSLILVSS